MNDAGYPLCTPAEIKKLYKLFAKDNFGKKSIQFLMKRDIYVLTEGDKLFTNSSQLKGVFVFTDIERAQAFIGKEKNATINTWFSRAWFTQMWSRACSMNLNLYINLTPPGDKTLFVNFVVEKDRWYSGCKDKDFHYTLPYGLKTSHGNTKPNSVFRLN